MTSPATGRGGCHSDSYVVPREDLRAQALRLCKQKAPSSMEAMQAMAAPETGPGGCHLDMHCCKSRSGQVSSVKCHAIGSQVVCLYADLLVDGMKLRSYFKISGSSTI